jgi:hypothetical protein
MSEYLRYVTRRCSARLRHSCTLVPWFMSRHHSSEGLGDNGRGLSWMDYTGCRPIPHLKMVNSSHYHLWTGALHARACNRYRKWCHRGKVMRWSSPLICVQCRARAACTESSSATASAAYALGIAKRSASSFMTLNEQSLWHDNL